MKSILIIGDTIYPDGMGGSHRHMYELCKALRDKSFNVCVITSNKENKKLEYEEIEGIKYFRYERRNNKVLGFLDFIIGPYKIYKKLLRLNYKFDVIHGHWPLTNYLIFNKEKSNDIKKVYTFHGPVAEEYRYELNMNNRIIKNIIIKVVKSIEKSVLEKSNNILVASNYMKNKIYDNHSIDSNVDIIAVPTNTDKFKPKFYSKNNAKKHILKDNKIVLLTIRRLQKRMGVDNLIRAFKDVSDKFDNVVLMIGGKGPYKEELEKLVKELNLECKVEFLGFIPEEEISIYYEAADLFIMPSIDLEGFGLSTTEAMAVGTSVVATPIGGNKEILELYNKNFLTKSIHYKDIAKKIIEIIDDKEYFEYEEKCRNFIVDNYSWNNNIDKFIEKYSI